MPIEETRAVDSILEPPASLERITAFLNEVTHTSAFEALPESGSPIGSVGLAAQNMADEVLGRTSFAGLLPAQKDRNALADKYSIQSRDVREFSNWLVKYRDKQEDAQNVIRVQVVDRLVEGPVREVPGPPRDLTQAELEALIREANRGQTVPPVVASQDREPATSTRPAEPTPVSKPEKESTAPTVAESREAVGFLNRGIWGSNLGFGGFAAGMAMATPGMGPLAISGAPMMYLGGGGVPGSMGGMTAFHGMPGMYGPGNVGGFGAYPPQVFDTAPGPSAMGFSPSSVNQVGAMLTGNGGLAAAAQLGQVTLLAPPIHVASEGAKQVGSAVAFDWTTLAAGAAPVDAGILTDLRAVLPEGTAFLYPAIPTTQLPPGSVNLNLAPDLSRQLMASGYGVDDPGLAIQSSAMAVASSGGTPQAMALAGDIVPTVRPMGSAASILDTNSDHPMGDLQHAGAGQARRGGALDFLGIPVRLAPTLGATSEVRQEQDIRASIADPGRPQIVRPEQFAPLKNTLFSAFQSVNAEPDKLAWQKAAPEYGLRDAEAETLLSPDSRVNVPGSGAPIPQIHGSSDELGRSMGQASRASEALSEATAAKSSQDIRAMAAPGGAAPINFSAVEVPALGHGDLPRDEGQHRHTFGGTAASHFAPGSLSVGPVASTGGSAGTSDSRSLSYPGSQASMYPSGSGGSASSASPVSQGWPSSVRSDTPRHLPMLGAMRPTMVGNTGITGPSANPTAPSYPSMLSPAMPSAAIAGIGSSPPGGSGIRSPRSSSSRVAMSGSATPATYPSPHNYSSVSTPTYSPIQSSSVIPSSSTPSMPHEAQSQPSMPQSMPLRSPSSFTPFNTSPSLVSSMPSMALRRQPTPAPAASPAVLQMSDSRATTPAGGSGHETRSESARSSEIGNAATEVNMLAREVWNLLKRRISHDAERQGLR